MGPSGPPEEKAAVLEQLERVLASPAFRNSRRYPSFLRHIVERTLDGRAADLKERTVGVEVFGRAADYDTNADPIVRVTAGEVRNRIARYYHEAGHEKELRIELPPGSYVPEFCAPTRASDEPAASVESPLPPPEPSPTPRPILSWRVAAGLLAASALIAAVWLWRPWAPTGPLERFWEPFLDGGTPVTICLARAPDSDPSSGRTADIGWPDVSAAVSVGRALGEVGGTHRLRLGDEVTFEDLRRAPAVLVGAFNDIWTLRLTQNLRFEPRREGDLRWVHDRQNPAARAWSVETPPARTGRARATRRDYAIVSRLMPSRTDKPVLMLAGLTGFGTSVAGEFVAERSFVDRIAQYAPAGWSARNLQVVLETEVIDGHAGPPRIVAVHVW